MRHKVKEVVCKNCSNIFKSNRINSLCNDCSYTKYYEINKTWDYCINCLTEKKLSTTSYCVYCANPIPKKLWKFNQFNIYNKSYNENILYRFKTEGDTSINRLMLIDAWVMITRYETKWLTKSIETQIEFMLGELEEYNSNLYTRAWYEKKKRELLLIKRQEVMSLKTI